MVLEVVLAAPKTQQEAPVVGWFVVGTTAFMSYTKKKKKGGGFPGEFIIITLKM